jgi:hypothetical protein
MINITEANTVVRFYHIGCFHMRGTALAPGRLGRFPDVNTFNRPNFLPCNFIGGLGRSGRSGRLYRDDWNGWKTYVYFPLCSTYRETRPERPDVRE